MNFKGVLVTDYNEINNLHEWHYIADTEEKAVQIAISQTSIDMSMIPLDHDFCDELLRLVNQGKIQKTRIDESVERVLNLKEELGIFENPVVNDPNDYLLQTIGSTEDKEIAYEVAIESVILAKNKDDMLPLSVKSSKKIFLTGPGADSLAVLSGGWTYHWQGVKDDQDFSYGLTIKSSIEFMLKSRNSSVSLSYHPGCNFEDFCPESVLNEALKLAAEADLVIYVTGEKPYAEKPGNIDDLNIDPTQSEYGKHLISKNINMVLVLLSGRPRTLGYLSDFASAILVGFLPGPSGAFAITDLIFGIRNPSGKFPISYPKLPNVSPSPYWHKNSQDDTYNVLWPFGFGLSYTSFAYSNLELSRNVISPADELRVSVFVWNTGKRAGKETVLMYIKDYYRIVTPEVKMLKGFKKVTLEAEESRKIEFTITAADLAFYGVDPKKKQLEDGKFSVMIGDQSLDFELTNSSSWQMI
jgi:beta-glucosidase